MRTEIQVDLLSFLTSGQTDITDVFDFIFTICRPSERNHDSKENSMSFLWSKEFRVSGPPELHLNISVCAVVFFSGTRAHNFYQIKIRTLETRVF